MSENAKTILITGATAGIGRHAALHLARRGHRVIATGRNQFVLDDLRAEAPAGRLETVRLDVTDAASIAAASREVDRLTGGRGLDGLVNNAGYGLAGPLAEITDADLRAQFETNVFGLMAVTRAFLPAMMRRRAGRVVNVSSMGGRFTFPFFGAYHASKYAVEALSDALRAELAPFGVGVVLIEPGPIRSSFADRSMAIVERYRDGRSPYAPVYARADELRAQADAQAVGPEHTSRAIELALLARRPRARYVVPFRVNLMLWAFAALPTRLVDWMMRRFVGLVPGNLGPVPPAEAPPAPRAEPPRAQA